jgi:hypothetical protein
VGGCGVHRTPRNGSGGGGVWKIALVILAAAVLAAPAEATVTTAAHVVAEVVKVTVIVLACLAALAVVTGLAVVAVRVRRRYLARAQGAVLVADGEAAQVPSWPDRPALGAPPRRAIEAPKVIRAEVIARGAARANSQSR